MTGYKLGLDIGGTKTLGVLIDPEGMVRAITKAPTQQGLGVVDVADAVRHRCEELGGAIAEAVGVGIPGVVAGDVVLHAVNLGITELPLAGLLSERLGMPVAMGNDVKAAVLGARHALGGVADLAYVNFGTGVSAGCLIGGRLLEGHRHAAGEIGHLSVDPDGALCRCGQRGCLEAYVADYALAREATTALNWSHKEGQPISILLESLYDHAKAGNTAARSIFRRAGRYLAVGLSNVVNLFDPSLIILSGERMRYDYLYAAETLAEMEQLAIQTGRPKPPIEIHAWGDLLWAHGAAALALSEVTERLLSPGRDIAAQ